MVDRAAPFTNTSDDGMNPVPETVTDNAPLPARTDAGVSVVTDGTGLGAITDNAALVVVPPPGAGVATTTV